MAKVKVQITLEDELLQAVDDYCDKNYMNRSWLISQSLVQVLNQQKVIDSLASISVTMRTVADSGKLDDAAKRDLEQFESLCKLLVGK